MNKIGEIKNKYIIMAGILIIGYIILLISTTYSDQKRIQNYQNEELKSFIRSQASTLDYVLNFIKSDIIGISNNSSIHIYFSNKALGMSMEYGLKSSLLNVEALLQSNFQTKNINGIKMYTNIALFDKENKILSSTNKKILINANKITFHDSTRPKIITTKTKNATNTYVVNNIYFRNKLVARIIALINLNKIFHDLTQNNSSLYLFSHDGFINHDESTLIKKDPSKYFDIPIKNTPLTIRGDIDLVNSFLSKWFVLFLSLLAILILVVLYFLILLNNKNIRLEEEKHLEKMLLQQSKLASMGEMIGNIAHQWRQPLSVISTSATGMKLQKEYGMLPDELFYTSCNNINDNAQYLSKTIDDFRNFIKGERRKEDFDLSDDISSFLRLVEGTIKNHDINLILDVESKIHINGYPSELIQCFINIFNNAKDALVENNIEDKYIFICTMKKDQNIFIKIKDNAGGIPDNILEKVFEPYFTTKHKSKGTGLGLHMTYNLIVNGMGGTIEANNLEYKYKNRHFKCAEIIITLPINQ